MLCACVCVSEQVGGIRLSPTGVTFCVEPGTFGVSCRNSYLPDLLSRDCKCNDLTAVMSTFLNSHCAAFGSRNRRQSCSCDKTFHWLVCSLIILCVFFNSRVIFPCKHTSFNLLNSTGWYVCMIPTTMNRTGIMRCSGILAC